MSGSSTIEISEHPSAAGPTDVVRRLVTALWAITTVLAITAALIVVGSLSTPAPEPGYLRGSVALFALAWSTIGGRMAVRYPRNAGDPRCLT
jgi:hypothetical protein